MPLYEEKLICPLAVRFTQEHIRPVFQHGYDIEASIKAIKTRPGTGEYDVILEAPFPSIEIIRWHQPDKDRNEADAKHWFTLDNRRLYCLQRAAAALWPSVAGVAVEALYNATEGILRKDDSSTVGRSVGIGHSHKALTTRWDWREAIRTADTEADARAHKRLAEDDGKASVEKLQDTSSGSVSAFERLICFTAPEEVEAAGRGEAHGAGSDASTTTPTPRSRNDSDRSEEGTSPARARHPTERLAGTWQGDKGEHYEVCESGQGAWVCWRMDQVGSKRFTFWHDEASGVIWWGTNYMCYMDISQFTSCPDQVKWYGAQDTQMRRPRFSWQKVETSQDTNNRSRAPPSSAACKQRPPAPQQWQRKEAAGSASAAGASGRRQGAGGSRWVPVQQSQ